MQNYENFCVYANVFSSAAVWGNLTRISTDGMCDFLRISTDFWRRSVLSLTDFTDFADLATVSFIAHGFNRFRGFFAAGGG